MNITAYHAKYFACELTKRSASDSVEKLSAVLVDAKVDLNPHQVEASLFAFKSPLSKGAILADEVGLGKTIEAGILLSQFWALGKRKLLIISPSSLRKQWSQEMAEKFYLPSKIFESKNFKEPLARGNHNPFEQKKIVICSYHFAKNKAEYIKLIDWDLVVIDEAHRLRNVYRPSNKIGKAIKDAVYDAKKVLLTATPLQNSLMELYGLVSIIDEHIFGDVNSFRSQFTRLDGEPDFSDLKDRISSVCIRTLRRQVQEYVKYTSRRPITIRFEPTQQEQDLYDAVSNYLQRDLVYALPNSQRHLLTLIMRKLLASSTYAIAGTLKSLINRLERMVDANERPVDFEYEVAEDFEGYNELLDEWEEDEQELKEYELSLEELQQVREELAELHRYYELAISIQHNAKGEQLLVAIDNGFKKLKELGAAEKTIIFTESRRTQDYIFRKLQDTSYAGKVVLFNGTNNDDFAKKVYKSWLDRHQGTDRIGGSRTADKRQALVDFFREEAQIMIATEAAAEGINLQFCSMLINYDLPWNPQRVEQRIGRCHRYGQKHDVVVVNFLNVNNAADQRVYQLLEEKFKLFDGVFGSSDDVLGVVESGVDFEKKIAEIYQRCRTTEEINRSFDQLQQELDEQIQTRMKSAREKLMENFDGEVIEKLKIRLQESRSYISRYEEWLWWLTRFFLKQKATFDVERHRFILHQEPFNLSIPLGTYTLNKADEEALRYRANHPLARAILLHLRKEELPVRKVTFNLSNHPHQLNMLEGLKRKQGVLKASMVEVSSLEDTDHIIFSAFAQDGEQLSQEQALRLFSLGGFEEELEYMDSETERQLEQMQESNLQQLSRALQEKDNSYFRREVQKLNRWAEDRIFMAEKELRDVKKRIQELNRQATRPEVKEEEQLQLQKDLQSLNRKKRKLRGEIFDVEDAIEEQRDQMIEQIEKRMQRKLAEKPIFTILWEVI
jgi:ERCC4-related helicase